MRYIYTARREFVVGTIPCRDNKPSKHEKPRECVEEQKQYHYTNADYIILIMLTKLIVYRDMSEISDDPAGSWTKKEIIENCFHVYIYEFEGWALDAYANTRCTWSKLVDEGFNDASFINEAVDRILNHDYEWLEENFC